MRWKLVPVEPTKGMISRAEEMYMPFGEMIAAWDGFIMTIPDPTQDEALVGMLADTIQNTIAIGYRDEYVKIARAVLEVLKGGV